MSPVVQPAAELAIHADLRDARRAARWLRCAALAESTPQEQIVRLDHCLDEALANVIRHGGPTALAAPVHLRFSVQRTAGACTAELSISDAGVPFDPSAFVAASAAAKLADATPGGLGLPMIRNCADTLGYRYSGGRNHLTITVSWAGVK